MPFYITIIKSPTRKPQRQIPSARPTNGNAFPETSGFSARAPIAAEPIFPTARPPPIHAKPTARAAAIYFTAEFPEDFASSTTGVSSLEEES